jgi:hypothetical protein
MTNRFYNFVTDFVAGTRIRSSRVNDELDSVTQAFADVEAEYLDDLTELFTLLMRGTEAYQAYQYSLKLTQTKGSRWGASIADVNVLHIYTTDQLIVEAASNDTPINGRMQFKMAAIPEEYAMQTGGAILTGYKWGWLKSPSSENYLSGVKIQIETEWTLELWSTFVYPEVE